MLPIDKLRSLVRRHEEVEELLCDPAVLADPRKLNTLNRERGQLVPIVEAMSRLDAIDKQIADDRLALDDPELGPLAREEIQTLELERGDVEGRLRVLLLPRDPNDDRNTILEIRGGTGGEEAALFAADLFRMYGRYAERRGWRVEILSSSEAAAGGLKELIALVTGDRVYSRLKHEGGVHRVQRVPATEAQGRIHTSTATVAVLPEAEDVELTIDEKDLKVDIAASGGPGGQGVNTTNSAVQTRRGHHQQRRPDHPHPERDRGQVSGRTQPAQESGESHEDLEEPATRHRTAEAGRRRARRATRHGQGRRSFREDPHLQLPAESPDRSPHRAHPV